MPWRPGSPTRRLAGVAVVASALLAGVAARVATVQTVEARGYVERGEAQRHDDVVLPADRGVIFDREGAELALSVPQSTVWADPKLVADAPAAAASLAPILGMDAGVLTARLSERDATGAPRRFVYLKRQVDDVTAQHVRDLDLTGVSLLDEPRRFYPAGDLARGLLGDTDTEGVGTAGIEAIFDHDLTGVPGRLLRERDGKGRTIPVGEIRYQAPTPGQDLVLTIDKDLQYAAEQAAIRQTTVTGARGAIVVVMDVRTGDLYAVANVRVPAPGAPPKVTKANLSVVDTYEPGSVNKVITMASAIEAGLVSPATQMVVPDHLQVSDHLYHDAHGHPAESMAVHQILAASSNVGTIKVAQLLGRNRLDAGLRSFGLAAKTGLGFPNESAGLLRPVSDWSGTSLPSISIGQGVSVTAMQMLSVYATIANGGVAVPPRLVRATVDGAGQTHEAPVGTGRRVVSPATAAQMVDMLRGVVTDADGTGRLAAIDGYVVAGKTGTALKPQANGTYSDDAGNSHYVSSFVGFVPADAPRLAILALVDEPTNGYYAGTVAAPLFSTVGKEALRQLRIPPTGAAVAHVDTAAPIVADDVDGPAPSTTVATTASTPDAPTPDAPTTTG